MEQGEAAPIRTLEAPTGLGKTLATLVGWLWDRQQRPQATPRRLVYQLPLRTLTEQIAVECRAVMARLGVAIPVHVLRGGQIDNDYADALAAEAVIVGTLDQVVSRQLMRGYCCSRWSWPRHFAALNTDVRVVVDETQLQGAAVRTAIRLQQLHQELSGPVPRKLVLCSATLDAAILLAELLKRISEIPTTLEFDAFGRIYEYFLGQFARSEGQKGGEFFTPSSLVVLITEIVEPFAGRLLDPACGSGGMYVQSARFVKAHRGNPAGDLAIYGVEKTDETGRLCRMNLAVHGLEGRISHGGDMNSYYEDPHKSVGAFDFVMANPPFNVNAVDMKKLTAASGPGRRFPFEPPKVDNANYLWIQLFYSSLNEKGRAGFVMANSASDARGSEQAIRQKLIEAKAVDVMVAVGPNMFYTVTLPCTLWFFDRGKVGTARENTVLFLDARHLYRQIDRAHRDWSEAQIGFLANIVRLYRGEAVDVTLGGEEAQRWIEAYFGTDSDSASGGVPAYRDIAGLCKAATLEAIEAQGWSLNPGRYVGVAAGEDLSDEDFKEQLEQLQEELEGLNAKARGLEATVAANVAGILEA